MAWLFLAVLGVLFLRKKSLEAKIFNSVLKGLKHGK